MAHFPFTGWFPTHYHSFVGLQQIQLMELPNEGSHFCCRNLGINVIGLDHLISETCQCGLAITPIPDVAGCVVKLVNQALLRIEDEGFTFHLPHAHVRPSLRAMICQLWRETGGRHYLLFWSSIVHLFSTPPH
jgi:hypothetical protein